MSSDATFSDHRRVDFNMTLKTDITGATPNLAQANWQRFREFLNRKQFKDPNFITKWWLDSAALKLEKYIQRANWQRFREFLNRKQFKDPNFITKCWLNSAALKLEKYIQRALKIVYPKLRT